MWKVENGKPHKPRQASKRRKHEEFCGPGQPRGTARRRAAKLGRIHTHRVPRPHRVVCWKTYHLAACLVVP